MMRSYVEVKDMALDMWRSLLISDADRLSEWVGAEDWFCLSPIGEPPPISYLSYALGSGM